MPSFIMSRTTLTILDLLRDTKVGNLDATLVIHKHVSALDIAMDDIPGVQVVQALENLANPVTDERFRECTVVAEQRCH